MSLAEVIKNSVQLSAVCDTPMWVIRVISLLPKSVARFLSVHIDGKLGRFGSDGYFQGESQKISHSLQPALEWDPAECVSRSGGSA